MNEFTLKELIILCKNLNEKWFGFYGKTGKSKDGKEESMPFSVDQVDVGLVFSMVNVSVFQEGEETDYLSVMKISDNFLRFIGQNCSGMKSYSILFCEHSFSTEWVKYKCKKSDGLIQNIFFAFDVKLQSLMAESQRGLSHSPIGINERNCFALKDKTPDSKDYIYIKGMALLTFNLNQRLTVGKSFYIARSVQNLQEACRYAQQEGAQKEFVVFYRHSNNYHYIAIKFERHDDLPIKNQIIVVDSVGGKGRYGIKFYDEIIQAIRKISKESIALYLNREARQTSDYACAVFAFKDGKKIQRKKGFAKELMASSKTKLRLTEGNVICYDYSLPPDFMYLCESPNLLETYIKENSEEVEAFSTRSKTGQLETLRQYAYRTRKGYGVESPKMIENRNYPKEGDRMIPKNVSTSYFEAKYKDKIRGILQGHTQDKLQAMIEDVHISSFRKPKSGSP